MSATFTRRKKREERIVSPLIRCWAPNLSEKSLCKSFGHRISYKKQRLDQWMDPLSLLYELREIWPIAVIDSVRSRIVVGRKLASKNLVLDAYKWRNKKGKVLLPFKSVMKSTRLHLNWRRFSRRLFTLPIIINTFSSFQLLNHVIIISFHFHFFVLRCSC